ncbi:MAG TPA: hypothetical protein ENG42_01200 [Candidatus Aenigmarchaeota archaeon]|nr:MAG: hypothetical protein DRP03_00200 [Candidatus Aenigmarchaeota archaeon]HDD46067.1 hypothetical protein [Candidatus Aenigmarchaeota archaeon]
MKLRFVEGKPALLIKDTLVIADLHIGIEREYAENGIKIPPLADVLLKEIKDLIKASHARSLILMGDIKHIVPGHSSYERKEVRKFLNAINEIVNVGIIKGNHDSNIENYIPEGVRIFNAKGIILENDFYLFHGHTWPRTGFLKAKYCIMAHIHPQIEIVSRLGYNFIDDVWVVSEMKDSILERYNGYENKSLPEVIIMPKFNKMAGGLVINKETCLEKLDNKHSSPLLRNLDIMKSKIFTLSGLYLGRLSELSH